MKFKSTVSWSSTSGFSTCFRKTAQKCDSNNGSCRALQTLLTRSLPESRRQVEDAGYDERENG